jgi:polyisoprenoid-binding protein YceI
VDGVTSLVEGQIVADYANPSDTTVGPIKVDLTGLTTDSSNRTGTLHRSILETGNPAFQFAEFTTTKLDGLPAAVTVGQPFSFKITGNLALHGVTKEVTFDATVTPVSETQLKGEASTTITYADWGVRILRLPQQVASVEDHTILKLEFVATAQ